MKKLLSLLLTLTMALSLFACTKPEEGGKEGDGPVTIYLPISRTEYKADGSKGHQHDTYTYTDKGLLLNHTTDEGLLAEIYNEAEDIYEYVLQPFDGTPNRTIEIQYNDRGHMLSYVQTDYTYDNATGELSDTSVNDTSRRDNYTYHYTDDGKVDYVDCVDVMLIKDITGYLRHYYDANGNLFELGYEHASTDRERYTWGFDYRYDQQGRLITYTARSIEWMNIHQYEYNDAGQLTRLVWRSNTYQAPLDDQHVRTSWHGDPEREHGHLGEVAFTYDAAGNLISRKCHCEYPELEWEQTFQYRDGKLYKIIEDERTIIITADESEAEGADEALIVDANGNVVKRINSDGSYIVFEYQAFRLSAEEAKIAQSSYYCYNRLDASGRENRYNHARLSGSLSACQTVTYPVTELYPYDVALKD